MSTRFLPMVAILVVASIRCPAAENSNPPTTQPTLADLNEHRVIGLLGKPVGTVVEIQATIVAGRTLNQKGYQSSYLLRVNSVDGHLLKDPPLMEFSAHALAQVKLPRDEFELYELKTGSKAATLDDAKLAEIEKGFVGKQVRLVAYETGGYSGIPDHLPDGIMVWQDRGFGFSTWLVLLAQGT